MTLGDKVFDELGEGTLHTRDEIYNAIDRYRTHKLRGISSVLNKLDFWKGFPLEEQARPSIRDNPSGIIKYVDYVMFKHQDGGYFLVYREAKPQSNS